MKILPRPQRIVKLAGSLVIDEQTKVYSDSILAEVANQFIEKVKGCNGLELQLADSVEQAEICFVVDNGCHNEGYCLNIAQGGLTVMASSAQGAFYAVKSLVQLLELDTPQEKISCENYYIEDYPNFGYRGLHFDIARHFFGVDTIKLIIDLMSEVKLNKLHLHLTDDQGFRIQIDKYPLLTQVGSVRGGSEVCRDGSHFVEEIPHSGFLTKADVAEIVSYAKAHFIDVIPELDIPGHFVSALAAYPEYSCTGKVSEVRQNWGISKDILCAGNEDSYKFVCDILDEICEMFPYEYIHLGGDEAPKERWCNCKKCVEKMTELKLDNFEQLQNYMVEFFASYLAQVGKRVICWNDGVHEQTSLDIISQIWLPGSFKKGVESANAGRQVIMSPFFNMYFDYPYGMTPLSRTLKFRPLKGVKAHARQNVLGVEGTVWTEYIADYDKLFFNLLPRLDALANCGWSGKTQHFGKALQGRLARYKALGLTHNHRALGKGCSLKAIKTFFKIDANDEMIRHKKLLDKKSSKK